MSSGPKAPLAASASTAVRWPQLLVLCLAVVSLTHGLRTTAVKTVERGLFWDVEYYRAAAERATRGLDPYLANGEPTGYFYSPSVTPLVALVFEGFDAHALYGALIGVALVAALALVIAACRRPEAPLLLAAVYTLAFGNGKPPYLFVSGNLAWLVGLGQAAALYAAFRGKWRLFYLIIGCAALVKPHALAMLLVPLAMRALSPWVLLALAPPFIDFLLGLTLWSDLAQSRAEAIWTGLVEPLRLRYSLASGLARGLVGLGLMGAGGAIALAMAVQTALAATLALLIRARSALDPTRALALATIAACCALPRVTTYDAFVFGPAVFFAFWPARIHSRAALPLAVLALGLFKEGMPILPLAMLAALLTGSVLGRLRRPERSMEPLPGAGRVAH